MTKEEAIALEYRTKRNVHVNCLKRIRYSIEHRDRSDDYDGYYANKLIDSIVDILDEHDREITKTKFSKKGLLT